MKLFKRILLATPALLVAGAAYSADLPAMKAAPIQYVRVCDAYGAGFFYIPGTDTCLYVGGYVRFTAEYTPGQKIYNVATGRVSQLASAQDTTGSEVRGRIDIDARTQTAWGTVQTVVWLRGLNNDGIRNLAGSTNFSTAYAPGGNGSTAVTMERAFIRFAGLTAGVSTENFSIIPGYLYGGATAPQFPSGIKQLAYTATFGNGFSSTIAIESRGDISYNSVSGLVPAPSVTPTSIASTYVNRPDTGYVLVGNVRYDQSWGFAQVMGAVTNNSVNEETLTSTYSPLEGAKTYGAWAAGFGFRYNLPFIAPGDQFHFEAQYAHGLDGLVMTNGTSSIFDSNVKRFLGGIERVDSNLVVTHVDGSGNPTQLGTENAFSLYGIFTHYWAPTWRSNFGGGYAKFMEPTAFASNNGAGLNTQLGDASLYVANANLIWSPTKNFDIGLEVDYAHINQSIQNPSAAFVSAGEPGLKENQWGSQLRLERLF